MSDDRTEQLASARLYLVCDATPTADPLEHFLATVIEAGVEIVQLREKAFGDEALLEAAVAFREICHRHGALFILNDRPDLAVECGADGAHVGQDDMLVPDARAILGPQRILGLSTHSPEQIDTAQDVDYIGVGPINATPTKPGRPAVGLELVRYASARATLPFFAIGGINPANIDGVVASGATRVAAVRAIAASDDPAAATRTLRSALR